MNKGNSANRLALNAYNCQQKNILIFSPIGAILNSLNAFCLKKEAIYVFRLIGRPIGKSGSEIIIGDYGNGNTLEGHVGAMLMTQNGVAEE